MRNWRHSPMTSSTCSWPCPRRSYRIDACSSTAAYLQLLADRAMKLADAAPEEDALSDGQTRTVAAAWALSIDPADMLRPAAPAGPLLQLAAFLAPTASPAPSWQAHPAVRSWPTASPATPALVPHEYTPGGPDDGASLRRRSPCSKRPARCVHGTPTSIRKCAESSLGSAGLMMSATHSVRRLGVRLVPPGPVDRSGPGSPQARA